MEKEEIKKLQSFVANEPLLENVVDSVSNGLFSSEEKNIFFGTGLCTSSGMSEGLPFDVLSMIFVAESIRSKFGFGKVIHHIADTHAKSNAFDPDKVDQLAIKTRETLERVFKNFRLENFEVSLASEFDTRSEFVSLLNSINLDAHEYVQREVADIKWFQEKHNVQLKLGWTLNTGSDEVAGHDERFFDQAFNQVFPQMMSFLYLKPGRTFNRQRQRVSPYITLPGENRVMLLPNENVERKFREAEDEWSDKFFGGTRKHLEGIVRLYEKVCGERLSHMSLEERVQHIINVATK